MSDFTINEMLSMQKQLQNKYKDKWEAISPEAGKHKLLWMIGEIVNERRGISADTALRLAIYFNNTSDFWMNLQTNYDLKIALKEKESEINSIQVCSKLAY